MDTGMGQAAGAAARTGGRVLADALVAHGIDHVFAVPGESYLDVLDGLYAVQDRVRLYTCRFEAVAVNAAEAHGKLTGRPAAAMVTRGPGACHASSGVLSCMATCTPMLAWQAPGPRVTMAAAGRPVSLPWASAAFTAPASKRHVYSRTRSRTA